jgi:hypothetical protein
LKAETLLGTYVEEKKVDFKFYFARGVKMWISYRRKIHFEAKRG